MVCAPVRSIIPSLKLGDYLSVQAHKPCSISHILCLPSFYDSFNLEPYSAKCCVLCLLLHLELYSAEVLHIVPSFAFDNIR